MNKLEHFKADLSRAFKTYMSGAGGYNEQNLQNLVSNVIQLVRTEPQIHSSDTLNL